MHPIIKAGARTEVFLAVNIENAPAELRESSLMSPKCDITITAPNRSMDSTLGTINL